MMKIDEPNPNSNPNLKKSIFFSKQRRTKTNRELNIHLFKKISCNSKISTSVSKKSFHTEDRCVIYSIIIQNCKC